MKPRGYQRAPSMEEATMISADNTLHPNYPFLMAYRGLNFQSDDDDSSRGSNDQFASSISTDLLVDVKDVSIGEKIGEGSSSIVYKGLFRNVIPVSVKIFQPQRTSAVSTEHKERFLREVLLLSKIKHENIVQLIGVCIEPKLMIITELMEGGTLQKFMLSTRPKPLDLNLSISFALDIARGMEFSHENGIIHRDLKPSNMLLTGDQKHLKLADFGHAREKTKDFMTCEAGTYRWMAPELFSCEPLKVGEKKQYNHKVDVYSFAIVFWELLTNKTPFKGKNNMSAAYAVSQNQRPSVENLPEGAVSILQSCWAEDPNTRPEFKEIIVSLTNLLRSLSPDTDATSSNVATDDSTSSLVEERVVCDCPGVKMTKTTKRQKKTKKVMKMIVPFLKIFKSCVPK